MHRFRHVHSVSCGLEKVHTKISTYNVAKFEQYSWGEKGNNKSTYPYPKIPSVHISSIRAQKVGVMPFMWQWRRDNITLHSTIVQLLLICRRPLMQEIMMICRENKLQIQHENSIKIIFDAGPINSREMEILTRNLIWILHSYRAKRLKERQISIHTNWLYTNYRISL